MNTRMVSVFHTTTALLMLAAVALWMLPANVEVTDVAPPQMAFDRAISDGTTQTATLLEYESIPQTNVFAVDRVAPATRYRPPGQPEAPRPVAEPASRRTRYVLYGVATGPSGAIALIDADPAIPGAEIYRPGDAVGVYHLETVGETSVVLRSNVDSLVLRLELPSRRLP